MLTFGGSRLANMLTEMERMNRERQRSFDGQHSGYADTCSVFPPLNVYDDDESFFLRAEVPGIDPKTLEISATAKSVSIKGERLKDTPADNASYHRRERDYGNFNRSLNLPQTVNPDKIVANYKLGVLEIILPKADEVKPRRIAVGG